MSADAIRQVAVTRLSVQEEVANVVRGAASVIVVVWIYLAATLGDGADERRSLLPYQSLIQTQNTLEQRMFRELQEGLLEAELLRSADGAWPLPTALAETGIPPFAFDPTATLVDTSDLDAVRDALRPNTKLVHTETIANPTTRLTDIAALAEIVHAAGALLSIDSTFTPPPLSRPVELGADLSIHSLTKYINGHGDAMGGSVAGRRELIQQIKSDAMVDVGGVISPFNAWLINRGSITLPLRLRQHNANALEVAQFLAADPRVAHVSYPGLTSHPQHDLARRVLRGGFGGMLAFTLATTPGAAIEVHNRFVANLRVVTSAVSLGHDESLIVYVGTTGPRVAYYPEPFRTLGHLRFSVGIEDPADLLTDLAAALDATFA